MSRPSDEAVAGSLTFEWAKPPPRGHDRLLPARDKLLTAPGEWALIVRDATTTAASQTVNRIRQGHGIWAEHKWEAVSRKQDNGKVAVYARCMDGVTS